MEMTATEGGTVRSAIRAAIAAGHEEAVHAVAYHKGKMVLNVWEGLADPARGIPATEDTL